MENGKIVEQGNHAHLLTLQGAYYRLYMSQFAGEQETAVDDSTAVHS
jgi:ATP-binding cassette subfamily B protein